MASPEELEKALARLLASGNVEVREDEAWLAELTELRFEVRRQGNKTLLHLWSPERNLVRSVVRVLEESDSHLSLEVNRFGRKSPGQLEFQLKDTPPRPGRVSREKFRARFRRLLQEQFPDEQIESLTAAPDLEHSLSGAYVRALLRRGTRLWAALAASPAEDPSTIDASLSFALLWFDRSRQLSKRGVVEGLRLFLPSDHSRITAHRLRAISPSLAIQIFAIDDNPLRARAIDPRDTGNLETRLVPRRDSEQILFAARNVAERICALAPKEIEAVVPPGTAEVAFRYRGLEFARWHNDRLEFQFPDREGIYRRATESDLRTWLQLVRELRNPETGNANQALYRVQAERWLESLVLEDPARIDAQLDAQHLYRQVPAFSAGDRGVIDLLGVTRSGRLVVIELKAAEDLHLVLQAADYWLRVRQHYQDGDFPRYGYFTGMELQPRPPLLFLVAPGFRFHPATDVILRYLNPEIEVTRIGLNENWRQGLQVVLRQ